MTMKPIALSLALLAALLAYPRPRNRDLMRRAFSTREGALFYRLTADLRRPG